MNRKYLFFGVTIGLVLLGTIAVVENMKHPNLLRDTTIIISGSGNNTVISGSTNVDNNDGNNDGNGDGNGNGNGNGKLLKDSIVITGGGNNTVISNSKNSDNNDGDKDGNNDGN